MAVRTRACDLEHLSQRDEGLALQRSADDFHQIIGQMRKITQCLVLDAAAFAVTAPQQVRAIDPILVLAGRGDYMSGSGASRHARHYRRYSAQCQYYLVTTQRTEKRPLHHDNSQQRRGLGCFAVSTKWRELQASGLISRMAMQSSPDMVGVAHPTAGDLARVVLPGHWLTLRLSRIVP